MFEQMKVVVDFVRPVVAGALRMKSASERKTAVLELLKTYFLLKDCVDEGENLIDDAGNDPVAKIQSLDSQVAIERLTQWNRVLFRQSHRLYALQGHFCGLDHLTVIDPELKEKLETVIGDKLSRTVTLFSIGAALYFRFTFPVVDDSVEAQARYVALMAGERGDKINMQRVKVEIQKLRQSLNEYQRVINQVLPNEEILKLSAQARMETLFESE